MKALLEDSSILQPNRGDDQEDGEDDHEEVEDEDAGEGGGKLVHQPGEPELSYTALIFIFLVNIDTIIISRVEKEFLYIVFRQEIRHVGDCSLSLLVS